MSISENEPKQFSSALEDLCMKEGLQPDISLHGEAFQSARCSSIEQRLEIVWSKEEFSDEQLVLQGLIVQAASESRLPVSQARDAFIGHIAFNLLEGVNGKTIVGTLNSSKRLFIPFYTTGLHTPVPR